MAKPLIEANIYEIDGGPHYPVRLHAVPHVGELIDLWSFIEQKDNKPPKKRSVTVFVRPSNDRLFE